MAEGTEDGRRERKTVKEQRVKGKTKEREKEESTSDAVEDRKDRTEESNRLLAWKEDGGGEAVQLESSVQPSIPFR